MPDRPSDFRGCQHRGTDLVKQRLEQVMVALIDDRDPHAVSRGTGKALAYRQPAEAGAHGDDVMRCCLGQRSSSTAGWVTPTTAYPAATQASSPPYSGRTLRKPW